MILIVATIILLVRKKAKLHGNGSKEWSQFSHYDLDVFNPGVVPGGITPEYSCSRFLQFMGTSGNGLIASKFCFHAGDIS